MNKVNIIYEYAMGFDENGKVIQVDAPERKDRIFVPTFPPVATAAGFEAATAKMKELSKKVP